MAIVQQELKNAYIGELLPTGITLDKSSISLYTVWQTEQLTATVEPSDAPNKTVTWSSDDTTVATVDTTGLVTCVNPWDCTITATTVNWLTATCSVGQWWTPWVNTYAYYPLTTDANDATANNRNLSADASITYSTANWALLPSSRHSWMLEPFNITSSGTWTISWWQNTIWIYQSDARWIDCFLNWSNRISTWWVNNNQDLWIWNQRATVTETSGVWYHHVVTISNWVAVFYMDWEQKLTNNVTTGLTSTYFRWGQEYNNAYYRELFWYLKDIIIEDVVWTGTDVSNYFNLTKGDYWK